MGMTTRPVKIRIIEHKSNIRCGRSTTKMCNHYIEKCHTIDQLTWSFLEANASWNATTLFRKEQPWVFRLRSNINGLNDEIPWIELQSWTIPRLYHLASPLHYTH